ncbi:MAG TPA: glycine--tRNA ligase [Actinomycetota bacterium]|nr:glycine--tRNA ligase [Actinomycetota bacterium]
MDDVVALAKRRGIAFQSSELYGGLRSSWDYGPLGVELRRNIRDAWWRATVQLRDDVVGLEAAVVMSPKVWEASGHVATFHDPLVECLACHQRFRADHLEPNEEGVTLCPNCGNRAFTEPRQFNMMLKTHLGPVEDDEAVTYLRPETAQGMFVDFAHVQTVARKKIPFGIAQIGKAFRNEITPGNFIFRTREFEQMEMEFFIEPDTDDTWFPFWVEQRVAWYTDLGVRPEKLRLRDHEPDELAHYAKAATDIEYEFPFGWQEIEGIANRTDYDLAAHQAASGEDLTYFDQEHERRFLPWVVEPAAGVDRALLTFLVDAYRVEEAPTAKGGTEKRTYLALHRDLAPIKAAVLPLSRNETLVPTAREAFDLVKGEWMCDFDDAGSIGRRYRRQDEVGTPYCVTVDFDSIEDRAVTVRDRDTMAQERVPMVNLVDHLKARL